MWRAAQFSGGSSPRTPSGHCAWLPSIAQALSRWAQQTRGAPCCQTKGALPSRVDSDPLEQRFEILSAAAAARPGSGLMVMGVHSQQDSRDTPHAYSNAIVFAAWADA